MRDQTTYPEIAPGSPRGHQVLRFYSPYDEFVVCEGGRGYRFLVTAQTRKHLASDYYLHSYVTRCLRSLFFPSGGTLEPLTLGKLVKQSNPKHLDHSEPLH